jgi:hypothetical protein
MQIAPVRAAAALASNLAKGGLMACQELPAATALFD